ncbi:MAG: Lrp/AsnC family transcriptional regulator [Clostridia bacterium]|nr:Lrp/AsnC family transcriptional regulator [Clostridia bacterium]
MDELQKTILDHLEQEARVSNAELAVMLGTSEQNVSQAIAGLERDGVILKYTAVIDEEKLDNHDRVQALIEVRITPQRDRGFDGIAERIARYEEVQTVYLSSGSYDLMVVMQGRSMRDIAQFVSSRLSTIDGVLSTATHFVLKKYKDQGVCYGQTSEDTRLKVTP